MTTQPAARTTKVDTVCGMTMDVDDARHNDMTVTYEGTEYPFCCDGCKSTFEDDPQTYHQAAGEQSS